MKALSPIRATTTFLQLLNQRGNELEDVRDDAVVRDLENRSARARVDREDEPGILHAGDVLHRPADSARDVQLRPHGLPALAYLAGLRKPLQIGERARRAHHPPEDLGELLDDLQVLLLLDAAPRAHDDVRRGDVDVLDLRLLVPEETAPVLGDVDGK